MATDGDVGICFDQACTRVSGSHQLDQNNDTAAAMPLKLVLHTGLSGASSGRPQV